MPKRSVSEESLPGLLATAVVLAYLLPTLIALTKGQSNIKLLFFINLLTGWTVVGWAALLAFALLVKPNRQGVETDKSLLDEYALLTAQLTRK